MGKFGANFGAGFAREEITKLIEKKEDIPAPMVKELLKKFDEQKASLRKEADKNSNRYVGTIAIAFGGILIGVVVAVFGCPP